jgi:hypothetical protein
MEIWASTLTVTFGTRIQRCQLYAPAALHSQGNFSVLFSLRGCVDLRATACRQKESATWKLNPEPPVLWCSSSTNWATLALIFNLVLTNFPVYDPLDKPLLTLIRNLNFEYWNKTSKFNAITKPPHYTHRHCVCNFISNLHVAIIWRSLSAASHTLINTSNPTDPWHRRAWKFAYDARNTLLTHWHTQPAVRRAEPSMPLLLILALGQ